MQIMATKKKAKKETKAKITTNIKNNKIFFGRGSSEFILDLYRKHGDKKEVIEKSLQKKVDNGDIECSNVPGRVRRIIREIHTREKAGFKV